MQTGQTISHYEIIEKLGQGGMGVVYLAQDVTLDRTVALKFLPADLSLDPDAKTRFVREAKAASALDHANICTVHEIAETDQGELYIVMAFYQGKTLEERLPDENFSVERAAGIALQLALAIERAHEAGIVHRDLKPANVMVTDRGEVKLLDFGIAKLASAQTLTQTGAIMGSSGYLSPEQIDGRNVDHRSDIWALGVILYQMLTKARPFTGEVEPAVMYAIVNKDPVPLSRYREDVPEALAAIVDRCLRKDANDRFESAGVLVDELTEVAGGSVTGTGTARRRLTTTGARNRTRLWIGLAVAVGVIATGVMAVGSRGAGAAPLNDDVLAVVPFTVRGAPEHDYLSEGMVDLMSAKLAGGFSTVNPRRVISYINQRGMDLGAPTTGLQLAQAMSAGRYLTGHVTEVGGRITLTAYLYDTEDSEAPIGEATVEGEVDDLFDVIDETVVELLAGTSSDPSERLQSLAVATSTSLPATKAYLDGERLLRGGRYREAAEAYDRATALDTAFALAYYRKSIAADWIDAYDIRSSADKAMELADRLSPRDRSLLAALRLRRRGFNDEAEQAYRSHLHQYPDEVEALVQLGELLFHDNPRRGRSLAESLAPFQQAVDLEPYNLIAQIHLARGLALADSIERLAETAAYLADVAPDSERALEVEAIYTFSVDDPGRRESILAELASKPWFYRWYAAHGVARFTRDIDGAAAILTDGSDDHPLLYAMIPTHLIVNGQHDEFRRFMAALDDRRNPQWDLYQAFVLTTGAYDASVGELSDVLGRLQTATAGGLLGSSWVPPYEDLSERFIAFERDYFIALLLIRLDRIDEAEMVIAELAQADSFPGMPSARDDAVIGLQAEVAYRTGSYERTLALLREARFEVPHAATVRAMVDGSRARFLRAEVEREIGDRDVARKYYRGLDESWSLWDTYYRPAVYERLGRMAEEDGRPEEAIMYYGRLIDLWRDADPGIVAIRREIEVRLDALLPD